MTLFHRALWLAVVASLEACASTGGGVRAGGPGVSSGPTITLSVVGTSDLHGGILQREDRGGLALLGGYVANLRAARARDGGAVLLIDAGDMFQGTLESNLVEGESVVAAYNTLGYAAAAVGNHEFDFGPVGPVSVARPGDDPRGALKARAAQASFPLLAANLIDTATGRPVVYSNVRPSTIVTAAGIRVGIVGVMTAGALSQTIAPNVGGLRVAPLTETIAAEAARLRARGASVVVVAAHAGGRCAEFADPRNLASCDQTGEIFQVARALTPGTVDAIVAGHTHAAIAHQSADMAISEAYAGGRAFGRVDLVVDRATKRVVERRSFAPRDLCARVDAGTTRCDPGRANASRVPAEYEGAPVRDDPRIAGAIAPGVRAAAPQKTLPLGVTLAGPIRREANMVESPLGNLFADAYLAAMPGADVVVNNTQGALRADLPSGPVTYGQVFEVMPFDNRLVAFHLTGGDLRRMAAAWLSARLAAIPGLAGLRAQVACRGGTPEIVFLRPNGAAVRDDERLLVATTDFLALGGDGIFEAAMPADGFAIERDAGPVRDIAVAALRRKGSDLREDGLVDPGNPRWSLPGPQPVTCGT